jgi:hypothetical protein
VNEVLAAIRANTIPLASVLVYDRKLVHDANSLSLDDATASTLQLIGDFNRKYRLRRMAQSLWLAPYNRHVRTG